MKILLSLSAKTDINGRKQLMVRICPKVGDVRYNMRAKSEIYIDEDFFDVTQETGINARMISAKRIPTAEVVYHREQSKKILDLLRHIAERYEAQDKNRLTNDWLSKVVQAYLHPMQQPEEATACGSFAKLAEEYLATNDFSKSVQKNFHVLVNTIARYEGFVNATQPDRRGFVFDVATVTREDIEDLRDYMANEKELSEEYPNVFARIMTLQKTPSGRVRQLSSRGGNAIYDRMKRLRSFFNWCYQEKNIANRPFEGLKLGMEHHGTPIYITVEERKQIASAVMPTKHLETQRDIFIFQSLVGCRVGDLTTLTENHITDGVLVYTPQKTKDKTSVQARVPLLDEALNLIDKYRGKDKNGRLFPFISDQQYNKAIKEVFTIAGITRMVEVRNALTGEKELRPINKIASSHMARRTFVGNLYFNIPDPNLIAKMSGHKENSRAFSRYRKVEDKTLFDVLNAIK